MRAPDYPMYALVVWPDADTCERIALAAVPAARLRKALVIAREDEILSEPLPVLAPVLLSGPKRYADDTDYQKGAVNE